MKRRTSRIYSRGPRLWADFRDFADVGGRQEPLMAPGAKLATTDPDEAARIVADRLKQLEAMRRDRSLFGLTRRVGLGEYSTEYLRRKAAAGKVTDATLEQDEAHLRRAVAFFGEDRPLSAIQPADVRRWIAALRATPSARGKAERKPDDPPPPLLTDGTVRHHINTLSNLFRVAQEEQVVPQGVNPVSVLMDKPAGRRGEAVFLEVSDAAFLLECARQFTSKRADLACPFLYPMLATFLLTGGRLREVLGLQVSDVHFERATITFRPNPFRRRLKTEGSARVVKLWPQLAAILHEYLNARTKGEVFDNHATRALLFPADVEGDEQCLSSLPRKAFAALLDRAGMKGQGITPKVFRHTYTSARLQTLDHGAPVSVFTVSRELGHGGTRLVESIYGHLGQVRYRSDVVAYDVAAFPKLAERLESRGFRNSVTMHFSKGNPDLAARGVTEGRNGG